MPPTIDAADVRNQYIDFRGDPDDIARVTAAAAARGVTPSQWAGTALADALEDQTGWRDGARRAAPQRPRGPREDRQTDRHLSRLAIRVSAEEKRRLAEVAGGNMSGWAWAAIRAALEKGN